MAGEGLFLGQIGDLVSELHSVLSSMLLHHSHCSLLPHHLCCSLTHHPHCGCSPCPTTCAASPLALLWKATQSCSQMARTSATPVAAKNERRACGWNEGRCASRASIAHGAHWACPGCWKETRTAARRALLGSSGQRRRRKSSAGPQADQRRHWQQAEVTATSAILGGTQRKRIRT